MKLGIETFDPLEFSPDNKLEGLSDQLIIGIELLKVRHDITKLDLTIPLLSLWCIDIDLNI